MSFLIEPGLWFEMRRPSSDKGRGALFLDRDGVINIDHGYVGSPDRIEIIALAIHLIRTANNAGVPVVVVTNQSGIGRGYFGWADFARTMDKIHYELAAAGAMIDLVVACAYHENALGDLCIADHPMRKPRPGMILTAGAQLGIERTASIMVGDSLTDMEAAAAAGLGGGAWINAKSGPVPADFTTACYAPDAAGAIALQADYAAFLAGRASPWGTGITR